MQTDISDIQRHLSKQQYSEALQRMWIISHAKHPTESYTKHFNKIADLYYNKSSNSQENLESFIDMLTDVFFKYPALKMAEAFYEKGANVYLYQFEHRKKLPAPIEARYGSLIKAYYGTERPFVFGDVLHDKSSTDEDKLVSRKVMELWKNFASRG